jgi:hypothetical protein
LFELPGRPVGIEEFTERHREIAVGVEVVDDLVGRLPDGFREILAGQLRMEMVAERLRTLLHVGHHVEVAVAGLIDLGRRGTAAIVIAVGIFGRPVVGPLEVGLIGMLVIDDQRRFVDGLGGRGRLRRQVAAAGFAPGTTLLLAGLLDFERLVVLNLLLDPLLQGQHRQLQNLHRLDHAGRKHLLLRQSHFLAERHPHRCLTPMPAGGGTGRDFPLGLEYLRLGPSTHNVRAA